MTLRAAAAPSCLVIDVDRPLSDHDLDQLLLAEYDGEKIGGIGRYVGLERNGAGDASAAEIIRITSRGFGLWLSQHVLAPDAQGNGWIATPALGQRFGRSARINALDIGYPEAAHLECDLEGVRLGTPADAVSGYAVSWATESAEFPALLYVGYDAILSPDELWALPNVHAYACDWGGRRVTNRGFVMRQTEPDVVIAGIRCDVGRCAPDLKGNSLVWAALTSSEQITQPDLGNVIA